MRKYVSCFCVVLLLASIVSCTSDDSPPGRSLSRTNVTTGCITQIGRLYVLPYPKGANYECAQSHCGSFSHYGNWKYAVDFAMPIGSPIIAARGGKVINVKEDILDGDKSAANFIEIIHSDSTIARYLHLTRNGALVELNQLVSVGDTIAKSGNTGFSTGPHLHFDIIENYRENNNRFYITLPSAFTNCADPIPLAGRSYTAQ